MAPAVLVTPRGLDHREGPPMDVVSVAYVLCRIDFPPPGAGRGCPPGSNPQKEGRTHGTSWQQRPPASGYVVPACRGPFGLQRVTAWQGRSPLGGSGACPAQ